MRLSLGLSKHWCAPLPAKPPHPSLHPQPKGQRNFLPKVPIQAPLPSEFQPSLSLETIGALMGQGSFQWKASCHKAQRKLGKVGGSWPGAGAGAWPCQLHANSDLPQ